MIDKTKYKIEKVCVTCGKTFLASKYRKGYFCSKECHRPNALNINRDFFTEYNSDMAYVLGLIFSDGYLTKPKGHNKLVCIKLIDRDILQQISDKMKNEKKVYYVGKTDAGNDMWRLEINHPKIVSDLENLGLYERKTFSVEFPQLPETYIKDFIRGYFDGDGCVHISKRKGQGRDNSYAKSFSILGNNDMLNQIQKHLPCESFILPYGNIFRLTVGKEADMFKVYDYIYGDDNSLFLERKKIHFDYVLKTLLECDGKRSVKRKKEIKEQKLKEKQNLENTI